MTPAQVARWVRFFQRRFTHLPDRDDLTQTWLTLVETHGVTGFRAHDVRLLAAMQCYGISRLLTFNGTGFRGFGITIVDPATV
jgi:hypothetical protein